MGKRYLLLGKDRGLKNDKLDSLKKAFLKEHPASLIKKFYALDKNDIKAFLQELGEESLFEQDSDFYIIENAEAIKEQDAKALSKQLESTDKVVVLLSDENKISATLQKLFDKSNTFIFYEMFENQKVPFLKTESAKRGLKIEDEAASLLLTLKDNDTLTLRKTLDEVLLYIQTEHLESVITVPLLYSFLEHDKEESGFTLVSHIAKRDKNASLLSLKNMQNEAGFSYQSLFPSLIFSLLRVEAAALNKEKGVYGDAIFTIEDPTSLTETTIRSPFEKNTIQTFLKNYKREEISRIVKLVIDIEGLLRESDTALGDILLTKMIADI